MIILTRLSGQFMAVNPDLIEKAEETPDTVITMVDGHKLLVSDSVADVVDKVRIWRASVAAEAFALSSPHAQLSQPDPSAQGSPRQGAAREDSTVQARIGDRARRDHPSSGQRPQHAEAVGPGSSDALARVLRLPARQE